MKVFFKFLFIGLVLSSTLCACHKNADKVLRSKKGYWNYERKYVSSLNTQIETGTFTFRDDDTIIVYTSGSEYKRAWSYNENRNTIFFEGDEYEIIEESGKKEVWRFE